MSKKADEKADEKVNKKVDEIMYFGKVEDGMRHFQIGDHKFSITLTASEVLWKMVNSPVSFVGGNHGYDNWGHHAQDDNKYTIHRKEGDIQLTYIVAKDSVSFANDAEAKKMKDLYKNKGDGIYCEKELIAPDHGWFTRVTGHDLPWKDFPKVH